MRFPIERAPAFANSQLYSHGGGEGPKPLTWNQSHPANFSYPWRDNFCEKRGKLTQVEALCPAQRGVHQGQDIRAASATKNKYWAVAAVNGKITKDNPLGSSSTVDVTSTDQSHFFRYLHLYDDNPGSEAPPASVTLPTRRAFGDKVTRGDRIGLVSAIMRYTKPDGTKVKYGTTTHLHFEIWEAGPDGWHRVPPYSSLVDSYHRLLISQPPP
jgi:murein DD-endopeptidase MepM/ murein hydrolase activator NlpD